MKVLIVSEFITPVRAIASIRWTKIGKYLSKNKGLEIDVLTNTKQYSNQWKASCYQYDQSLVNDLRYFGCIYEIPEGLRVKCINALYKVIGDILNSGVSGSHGAVSQKSCREDSSNDRASDYGISLGKKIYNAVYRATLSSKGKSYCACIKKLNVDWTQYDVVISSFGPKWVHRAARTLKQTYPNLMWVADYRDSAMYADDVAPCDALDYAKNNTKEANAIITVSSGTINALQLPPGQKKIIVTNGYDPEELVSRKRMLSKKFKIVYTGTLYNKDEAMSDTTPLFNALNQLVDGGIIDSSDIEFSYAGASGDEFEKQAGLYPMVPIKNYGLLTRSEALDLQNEASLLTLCTWNTKKMQGIITGKVYEYFSSQVPIVCLCAGDVPGSASREMIEKSNTGFCYEEACDAEDYGKLVSFVAEKYTEWKTGGMTTCDSNWDYINSFGYDHLADEVYELITDLQNEEDVLS